MAEKDREPQYGPSNPHPLSQLKTELVWEGKYDEHGNRREVDVAGADLPLQKIESIDEPRSSAEGSGQMDLFEKQSHRQDDFRNMLIWGDNKLVMASLLRDFRGKIDLIYTDPPFDVGADFTMSVPVGGGKASIEKEQSILEAVAYRDTWGRGTDSYIHMMHERLVLMRDLLAQTGSICLHCDWHASHLLKHLLIDVFGRENYRNEIIWWYYNKMQGNVNQFAANHDVLIWFSKSRSFKYNAIRQLREKPKRQQKRVWDPATKSLRQAKDENGELIYYTETERTIDDVWRLPYLMPADQTENVGFNTQKPVELVGRIMDALSDDGDTVLDPFCGSGTALVTSEGLRVRRTKKGKKEFYCQGPRRWIGVDLGRFAIHTSRKRIIELQRHLYDEGKPYRAFDVYNLGRYERQWWQSQALEGADEQHREIVLAFYRAEVLTGAASPLLHGRKGPAFVHVDGIDSILTLAEVRGVVEATAATGAKEVHCLAWEFEMDLKRNVEAVEHEYGVKARLVRIPREVMEKNRRPGVDEVPFFEMATLAAEPIVRIEGGVRTVDVKLTNFLPSLSEVPSKELESLQERAVKSGFDFIDFWAVDFDHHDGQPFNHHWQDYRLRKDRTLKTVSDCGHEYEDAAPHTICVKVIDVFGCDTSTLLKVPGAGRQ